MDEFGLLPVSQMLHTRIRVGVGRYIELGGRKDAAKSEEVHARNHRLEGKSSEAVASFARRTRSQRHPSRIALGGVKTCRDVRAVEDLIGQVAANE